MSASVLQTGEGGSTPTPRLHLYVAPVAWEVVRYLVTEVHYAKRAAGREFCFGLFEDGVLVGGVTYGPPSSPQVARSVRVDPTVRVLELTRLIVTTPSKNAASRLVGISRRFLPTPLIIVSYADAAQGHVGYVYQATGFKYGGLVRPHDSEYLVDGVRVHPRTLAARGVTSPRAWARTHGITAVPIEPKHRYWWASEGIAAHWASLPYPKGDGRRYDAPNRIRVGSQ